MNLVECEISPCKSVADALVQMVVTHPSLVVLIEPIPIFDLSIFVDILMQHVDWKTLPILAVHFPAQRHLFPTHTHHVNDQNEAVRMLKELISTL